MNNLGWKLFNALFPRTLESFARRLTSGEVPPSVVAPIVEKAQPSSASARRENNPEKAAHPLSDFTFHLVGSWRNSLNGDSRTYFTVAKAGQAQFIVSDRDLVAQGYAFRSSSECVGQLWYNGVLIGAVVCDSPRVSLDPGQVSHTALR